MSDEQERPPLARRGSLSAKLLLLTVFYVMLIEVLIFVPSMVRFYSAYLKDRLAVAHVAVLTTKAAPTLEIGNDLAEKLLEFSGADLIVLREKPASTIILQGDMPTMVDVKIDLRAAAFPDYLREAFMTLATPREREIRVIGPSPKEMDAIVEIVLRDGPLKQEIVSYAERILILSLVIALTTGTLLYLSLRWLMVRPMQRLTAAMADFRENPEDPRRGVVAGSRTDEIGVAEHELARLQSQVREALHQKTRLAALGTAVTKINHDLRNILTTAQLISDRILDSTDSSTKRFAGPLITSLDRAVQLCGQTLTFAREGTLQIETNTFGLHALVDEIAANYDTEGATEPTLGSDAPAPARVLNETDSDLFVEADRAQLHRLLENLIHNAFEAKATEVRVSARHAGALDRIVVEDNGPGLPKRALDNLFQPFSGSARSGGTGLGLAIGRDIARAHGGDLSLLGSDATGAAFEVVLPRSADA